MERFSFIQLWRVTAGLYRCWLTLWGGVSGKTSTLSIAELIRQSPLLSIFAEYALHSITILDSTAMFAWLDLWI
jgi:hypothetical protein